MGAAPAIGAVSEEGVGLAVHRGAVRDAEVIIAGAGPVGLCTAIELGQRGVDCLVVEPRLGVSTSRPRAKTTNVRTMEHFRRWGIARRVRDAAYLPVDWAQRVIFATTLLGPEVTRFDDVFGLATRPVESFAEAGQQVPQFVVERVLREVCQELPSVDLVLGPRVTGLEQTANEVSVEIEGVDGAKTAARGSFLVGADGAAGTVRRAIGSSYVGDSAKRTSLGVIFRAPTLYERQPHGAAVHYWTLRRDAPGIMGRLDLGDTWWAIATGEGLGEDPKEAANIVHRMIGEPVPVEVTAIDPWRSRMLVAAPQQAGRVFLVGDAAHQNPPYGGHGFNTGVGDAVNLGWKLAAVLRGWGGPKLLDSYESERRPIQDEVIRQATANLRSVPGGDESADLLLDVGADEAARDTIAPRLQQAKASEFYSLGLVLGYSYHGSPLVVDDGEPPPSVEVTWYRPSSRPGSRLPHAWVRPGVSIYDELGAEFTLLRTGADDGRSLIAAFDRSGVPLTVVTARERHLRKLWAADLLLVRPDQHVAWRSDGRSFDADAIVARVRGG